MSDQTNDQTKDNLSRRTVVQTGLIGMGVIGLGAGGAYFANKLNAGPADTKRDKLPSAFEYDLDALMQVDEKLITYQAIDLPGKQPPGLGDAQQQFDKLKAKPDLGARGKVTGLVQMGQQILIADCGNRMVWLCDSQGKITRTIGQGDKTFIIPSPYFDLVADADSQSFWVTNTGKHRVEQYDLEGNLLLFFGEPGASIEKFCGCCNPISIAVLSDGRIVTAEKGLPRVKVYHRDGRLDSVVAAPATFTEQATTCAMGDCTQGGLDVAVDGDDNIWVLDRHTAKIHCFAENKKLKTP